MGNSVKRAEDWRWGRLWQWSQKSKGVNAFLAPWPVRRSSGWRGHVNEPQTDEELTAIRRCVNRGCPYGDENWSNQIVKHFGNEKTLTHRGRPRIPKPIEDM